MESIINKKTSTNHTPPVNSEGTQAYSWQYIIQQMLNYRRKITTANMIAIAAVLASIPIPLLFPVLIDEILLNESGPALPLLNQFLPTGWQTPFTYIACAFFASVILRVVAILLDVWQNREFTLVAKDITFGIRRHMLQHLQKISLAEYETVGSSGIASHMVTDMETIDLFIGTTVSKFITGILTMLGVGAILFFIQWQLAVLVLLLNPVVIFFTVKLGKTIKHLKRNQNTAFELFQQALTDTLDSIHEIRAANREKHYIKHVIEKARDIKVHSANYDWKSQAAGRFSFIVFLFGTDMFRGICMLMVLYSDLTVGQMISILTYLWFMIGPVQEVLSIHYSWFGASAALKRINELLALEKEPEYPHIHNPFTDKATVDLEVKNLSFAYKNGPTILTDISLRIEAGEKVALVGESGGGKSTFVNILLGIYPHQRGDLLYHGVNINKIGLDVVRENVATVLQQPSLFNDTIRENLSLGQQYNDQQLWQALEHAQLKKNITDLPDGLDAIIGRQGVRLSGGQKQRLAIARMILSNPKIVILDEATSALDTITEDRVHKAIKKVMSEKTMLIIAHRLSAVKQADRIYVFDQGHIVAMGTHHELLENSDIYASLYGEIQSS